ncbi:hypothetical protein [Aeromonas allosaccharophila]|uniref:hypothetical protein n=1 Tax=Aeromonas allosaccharophila TaxID=656 RepID=UPI002ADF52EA|nr:hypothetical protein [Aeromonas allosaccharophila]
MARFTVPVLILVLVPFFSGANILRHPSISKELRLYADISIASDAGSPVDVTMYNKSASLVWDANDVSFRSVRFDYSIVIDAFQLTPPSDSTLRMVKYVVGLRDINLSCSTAAGFTNYQRIDASRVLGFGNVLILWGDGTEGRFNVLGDNVASPEGIFHLARNEVLGRQIAIADGAISIQFPLLSNEVQAGGADCRGGALFLFSSVL